MLTATASPREACDEFVTPAFIEISYGGVRNCMESRTPDALADSIEVRSSMKTDAGIHLVVVPAGGPYDGKKVEVDLVRDGDGFRVDSLTAHVPAGP